MQILTVLNRSINSSRKKARSAGDGGAPAPPGGQRRNFRSRLETRKREVAAASAAAEEIQQLQRQMGNQAGQEGSSEEITANGRKARLSTMKCTEFRVCEEHKGGGSLTGAVSPSGSERGLLERKRGILEKASLPPPVGGLTYICSRLEPQQILLLGPCRHLHSSLTCPFFFPAPAEDKLLSRSALPVAVVGPSKRTSCPGRGREGGREDPRGQTWERGASTDFSISTNVEAFLEKKDISLMTF